MISCRDWGPWTKPGYITMTRRQRSNEWSGGIAAHRAPKKFRVQKHAGKVLASIFFRSRRHSRHWLSSKGPNYHRRVLLISAGANERCLKEKCRGKVTKGVLFLHDNPPAHRALATQRNWPTWASNALITHPILRIWPRRTTTCFLDWKNNWKVAIFRLTWRSLLPRRPGWTDNLLNFLSDLQKLEQPAKKCTELRGEYVE